MEKGGGSDDVCLDLMEFQFKSQSISRVEREAEICARDFAKECLPPLPRGMVIVILEGISQEVTWKCDANHSLHQGEEDGEKFEGLTTRFRFIKASTFEVTALFFFYFWLRARDRCTRKTT